MPKCKNRTAALKQGENGLLAVEIQIGSLPLDDRGKTFGLGDQKPTKIAMANGVSLRPPGCKIIEGHFCSALRFFIVPIVFQQDLQWQYHL
jgi:hypothetical protein